MGTEYIHDIYPRPGIVAESKITGYGTEKLKRLIMNR